MATAIVTGFDLFGSYRYNPTKDLAEWYDGKTVGDVEVVGVVLPCTYYGCFGKLSLMIEHFKPDIILNTGLSSQIPRIRLESFGRNIMNGKYPDAAGIHPTGKPPLTKHGNNSYQVTANNAKLAYLLFNNEILADISTDAEGFVCNSLLYLTAKEIHDRGLDITHTFFHTPWTDDYIGKVNLESWKTVIKGEDLRKAVEIIIQGMK